VPAVFPTKIHRNYTIVKDGLLNLDRLPAKLGAKTRAQIQQFIDDGAAPTELLEDAADEVTVINIGLLPIINRSMIERASADELFRKQFALEESRGRQKVLNAYRKQFAPKRNEGLEQDYGKESAEWLATNAFITDNGFAPKTVAAPINDYYEGKTLLVKLKGYSSLPSLKDVQERIAKIDGGDKKAKLTATMQLMEPTVRTVETKLKSTTDLAERAAWLATEQEKIVTNTRALIREMAKIKFAVVVGQTWFKEFSSLEENEMDLTMWSPGTGDTQVHGSVHQEPVQIAV